MKCTNCGFLTSWKRIRCPVCGSCMAEFHANKVIVLESWKLNVTPEGPEESYYINLVKVENGKMLCKSKEHLTEGSSTVIEGDVCRSL